MGGKLVVKIDCIDERADSRLYKRAQRAWWEQLCESLASAPISALGNVSLAPDARVSRV